MLALLLSNILEWGLKCKIFAGSRIIIAFLE